jgi:aryl-alcohol dehydrogenase-like predicted oxidoreductase
MLIPGFATPEGTARFRDRFAARLPGHYRESQRLWLSSIGLGTYLGEPTAEYDSLYREAIVRACELGTNVLDTAVNYRHMRSERTIAQALAALMASGGLARDEIFIATKGGFFSYDGETPSDPGAYFEERLVGSGLIEPKDVAAGCHAIAPRYLADQIEVSRRNLGLETLDLYYIHNPETQLRDVARDEFYGRLRAAFEALEAAVAEGKIRMYGMATWNAFRVLPESPDAVSLEQALRLAEEAGGREHHLRALQLPFNLALLEALGTSTQTLEGRQVPLLEAARSRGLMVFASASLLQSRLASGLPETLQPRLPRLQTDAQRALQFVRSTPGITCALAGMSRQAHVIENLATAAIPPLTPAEYRAVFED